MRAVCTPSNYAHFFNHLPEDEMNEIKRRIDGNISAAFTFYDNEKDKFCVIVDFDDVSVHVRHIGGPFAWCWRYIDELTKILAHRAGLKYVTVIAQKNFMLYAVRKLGFKETTTKNLYEKAV